MWAPNGWGVNPYKKKPPLAAHNEQMGRQSQQRVSNTKRAFQLASTVSKAKKKPKAGDQLTLLGEVAFDSQRDCKVCIAQFIQRTNSSHSVPKRAHHELCIKNTVTRGVGPLTKQLLERKADEKRLLALHDRPLEPSEKASGKHLTKESTTAFFLPRTRIVKPSLQGDMSPQIEKRVDLCKAVSAMTADANFEQKHQNKGAPLAMIALATTVMNCLNQKDGDDCFANHFEGSTFAVPPCNSNNNPHCHSVVGQKLLLADWVKQGIKAPCPSDECCGFLKNDRSNFSKNQTLFPVFGFGAPSWCVVRTMNCTGCRRRFDANEGRVLLTLPAYIAAQYPVETKYALPNKNSHLSRTATDVFDSIMLTYGNGELCSRILYDSINRDYIQRLKEYYSYVKASAATTAVSYIAKDGEFIRAHPPLGETIREMCDESLSTPNNPWGISDHDRNTREIQSVKCNHGIMAQDHTFEVVKNYQKRLGAKALWDVATSTGEIACAVLVESTKAKHFSHAARALLSRQCFTPDIMYTDTWPDLESFWHDLSGGTIEGRLGLFHYEKRMIGTMKKKHVDHAAAVADLLSALYSYHEDDLERLLTALKSGTLSGKKYTAADISELVGTKTFRTRHAKCLRKKLKQTETIKQNLDEWFCKYKVTTSDVKRPALGRLDPIHNVPLFTHDTKDAIKNCCEKAQYVPDVLPIEQMYDTIAPSPNSKHQLPEYLSRRPESKIEAFHDRLSNFGNSGMRDSLADNLNLMGTARYNLGIRHKRSFIGVAIEKNPSVRDEKTDDISDRRRKIPSAWEKVVPYFNHSELAYVNQMAIDLSLDPPFPNAEPLGADTGERFFSEYITTIKPGTGGFDQRDFCLCIACVALQRKALPLCELRVSPKKPNTNGASTQTAVQTAVQTLMTMSKPDKAVEHADATTTPTPLQPQQVDNNLNNNPHNNPCHHAVIRDTHPVHMLQPTPMQHSFPPAFQQVPPLFIPFHYYQSTPVSCCAKHSQWMLSARNGRPPHDAHCYVRGQQLLQRQKKALHQPSRAEDR